MVAYRPASRANDVPALGERIAALTTAVEVLEARARWLLVIAIGALAVSLVAGGRSGASPGLPACAKEMEIGARS